MGRFDRLLRLLANLVELFVYCWLHGCFRQQRGGQLTCSLPKMLVDLLFDFRKRIGSVGQTLGPLRLTKPYLFGKMVNGF